MEAVQNGTRGLWQGSAEIHNSPLTLSSGRIILRSMEAEKVGCGKNEMGHGCPYCSHKSRVGDTSKKSRPWTPM